MGKLYPDIVKCGEPISGKTKKVFPTNYPGISIFQSMDNTTAGDGAKNVIIGGKAILANTINRNIMKFINSLGNIPTAFIEQYDETSFVGKTCDMFPYEVICRRETAEKGSYSKCYPHVPPFKVFPKLIVQFFLKTTGKKWGDITIPVDDPLMIFKNGKAELYDSHQPIIGQLPFLVLDDWPLKGTEMLTEMERLTKMIFLALEKAWQQVPGCVRIIDFKLEFGKDFDGNLCLADVIDADSSRIVTKDNVNLDKQAFRDGESLDEVLRKFQILAKLTEYFFLPSQQLIVWTGSKDDDKDHEIEAYINELIPDGGCEVTRVVQSMHKEPIQGCLKIVDLVQKTPDAVVIPYVGLSNGAGPILSAQTLSPVISVPADFGSLPNNVFSSLACPSLVPNMTVVNYKNAVLAALQILALRNPLIYMQLEYKQEERLINVIEL